MVHSKLPVLPILCLLWAFPMPGVLSNATFTDPGAQKALAFAVVEYNEEEWRGPNYFKYLPVQKESREVTKVVYYKLRVGMVITACKKKMGQKMTYGEIQQCQELGGNTQKKRCYFKVTLWTTSNIMNLSNMNCVNA